nr:MAG TPA: hypothetical protein [Caudoviricetes sp.]DAY38652.1 MAG TPA: hypothetical protein [Caudoviricetes sp.]
MLSSYYKVYKNRPKPALFFTLFLQKFIDYK